MSTEQIDKLIAALEQISANINFLREEIKDGIPVFTKEDDSFGIQINNCVEISSENFHANAVVDNTVDISNADA